MSWAYSCDRRCRIIVKGCSKVYKDKYSKENVYYIPQIVFLELSYPYLNLRHLAETLTRHFYPNKSRWYDYNVQNDDLMIDHWATRLTYISAKAIFT